MNPTDPQQPQTNTSDLQKLEEDLKKLEQENQVNNGSQTTVGDSSNTNGKPPVNFPMPDKPVKKGLPLIQFAILLVVSAILATLCYVLFMQVNNKINILSITPKGCTAEAKLCPDGSGVGRTGPNCEFAACPTVTATPDPKADWKTYTNSEFGISFKLPPTWSEFTTSGGEYFSTDSDTKINLRLSKGIFNANDAYSLAFSKTVGQSVVSTQNTKLGEETFDGHPAILMSMDFLQDTQDVPSYSYVYVVKDGTSLYIFNFWQDKTLGQDIKPNIINNKSTFDQILSTFKFTSSGSEIIPSDISDLFSMVNKVFSSNIVPSSEDSFYSSSGMIDRSSWKLDLSSVVKNKEQINILHAILNKQLNYNPSNSADGVQGSFEAYNNSQIQCYLVLGTSDYLSCTTK